MNTSITLPPRSGKTILCRKIIDELEDGVLHPNNIGYLTYSESLARQVTKGFNTVSLGVGSPITDINLKRLVIDDPIQHPEHKTARELHDYLYYVLYPRLEPEAYIICVQSRCFGKDIASVEEHNPLWRHYVADSREFIKPDHIEKLRNRLGKERFENLYPL